MLDYIKANPEAKRADLTTVFRHAMQARDIGDALELMLNEAPPKIMEIKKPRADGKPGRGSSAYRAI